MATSNQISIEIPASVISDVTAKIQSAREALAPYLQALTDDQQKSLFKMGDKTVATVQKVQNYVGTNPEFAPGYMDREEFARDAAVVAQLSPVAEIARQLVSDIDDTVTLAGSEALMNGMLYYGAVNEAAHRGVASAKPIYDDLSQRFKRGSYRKKTE